MPLFSSAAPGKKAAPKAPARRRPAPIGPPPSAQPPSSAATSVAPPSPPPTQTPAIQDAPVRHELPPAKEPAQPSSEPVREPEVEQIRPESAQPAPSASEPATEQSAVPVIPASALAVQESLEAQPIVAPPPPTQIDTAPQPQFEDAETKEGQRGHGADQTQSTQTPAESQPTVHEALAGESEAQESRPEERRQVTRANVAEAASAATQKRPAKRTRASTSNAAAPRPAKRAKKSSTRSNAKVTAVANGEDVLPSIETTMTEDAPLETAPRRRQPSRKAATGKRQRNAKSAATIVDSDDETEGLESATSPTQEPDAEAEATTRKSKVVKKPSNPRKKTKRVTPNDAEGGDGEEQPVPEDESDAELHQIDPKSLSMWDLSYDTRHGKMSDMGKKMNEIDWDDVATKRRAEADRIASGGQQTAGAPPAEGANQPTDGQEGGGDGAEEGVEQEAAQGAAENADQDNEAAKDPSQEAEEATEEATDGVEQPEVTDRQQSEQAARSNAPLAAPAGQNHNITLQADDYGNFIINDTALDINRDEEAVAEAANDQPVEDINDFTVQVNRSTWINDNRRDATDRVPLWKWKSDPWSEEETDRFYDALRMFGTDFFIISKMFHPKTRRMIKTKFNREEKLDPRRINDALNGKSTVRMDLNHYARESSRDVSMFTQYQSLEHAQIVINESMKERQDAMTTAVQEEAQLEAERCEKEKEKQKTKERGKGKGSRKSKRGKIAGTFGGGGPDEGE